MEFNRFFAMVFNDNYVAVFGTYYITTHLFLCQEYYNKNSMIDIFYTQRWIWSNLKVDGETRKERERDIHIRRMSKKKSLTLEWVLNSLRFYNKKNLNFSLKYIIWPWLLLCIAKDSTPVQIMQTHLKLRSVFEFKIKLSITHYKFEREREREKKLQKG